MRGIEQQNSYKCKELLHVNNHITFNFKNL